MAEAEGKTSNQWLGPVLGAVVLIGGYVAYQEWSKGSDHDEMCASLKRRFEANFTGMVDSGAVDRSLKAGNQSPMLDIAGDVAVNQEIMKTLDAECPGWAERQY